MNSAYLMTNYHERGGREADVRNGLRYEFMSMTALIARANAPRLVDGAGLADVDKCHGCALRAKCLFLHYLSST